MGIMGISGITPPAHINEVEILFRNNGDGAELSVYFGKHLRSNNTAYFQLQKWLPFLEMILRS